MAPARERAVAALRKGVLAVPKLLGCLLFACSTSLACGGAAKPPEAATTKEQAAPVPSAAPSDANAAAEANKAAEEDGAAAEELPSACARTSESGICLPTSAFAKALCQEVYADVALVMFKPGTPWTRAYLRGKTEAWNASGGASVQGFLEFDEEVLILRERRAAPGGMQVGNATANYDALRWNGSCVSLSSEEVTLKHPPKALNSRVEWQWLSDEMQESLRANSAIVDAYRARRNECKGVNIGAVSKKCEELDRKLVNVVVAHVRAGGALATPKFPK